MFKNTSYNVRPDRHTSAEIALLKPEESVIVYDTDEKVNKFWNGTSWVSVNGESGQNLRIGKLVSGNTLNGEKIYEFAIWDSNQGGNISSIYNSGSTFDLSTLTTEPKHWWRMGDGDSYPYLQDNGTEASCIFQMYNMTSANIVTDTP